MRYWFKRQFKRQMESLLATLYSSNKIGEDGVFFSQIKQKIAQFWQDKGDDSVEVGKARIRIRGGGIAAIFRFCDTKEPQEQDAVELLQLIGLPSVYHSSLMDALKSDKHLYPKWRNFNVWEYRDRLYTMFPFMEEREMDKAIKEFVKNSRKYSLMYKFVLSVIPIKSPII